MCNHWGSSSSAITTAAAADRLAAAAAARHAADLPPPPHSMPPRLVATEVQNHTLLTHSLPLCTLVRAPKQSDRMCTLGFCVLSVCVLY